MADNRDRDVQSDGTAPAQQSGQQSDQDKSAVEKPAQGEDLGNLGNTGTTSTERSTTNKAQNVR